MPKKNKKENTTLEPATEKDDGVRVRVFEGHKSTVWRVAMPADGRFALTSSDDGTVRKWDLGRGAEDDEVPANSAPEGTGAVLVKSDDGAEFFGLAMTADGKLAAAGDHKGRMVLLDLAADSGTKPPPDAIVDVVQAHESGKELGGLTFSEEIDGGRPGLHSLAHDEVIKRWDLSKLLSPSKSGNAPDDACIATCWTNFTNNSYGLAASADGATIVAACIGQGLAVCTGEADATPAILKENVTGSPQISLTADGRFAFAGTQDGMVAQWDLAASKRLAAFEGHNGWVYAVTVTPDGRFCASGSSDQTVRLWAVESGQCLAVLRGHSKPTYGVAITPDARRIASVSDDQTLRVWDIPEWILNRAATAEKRGYRNAKVVLLGDSGVGKSGLALRLWHDEWEPTESTHGMEIHRLQLPKTPEADGADAVDDDEPGVEHEVWLWDLAGQPDYRLTHQLFMDETSLALLVFDPQDPNLFDTVGYWQNALEKVVKADRVAGLLVAARCDRPGLRLSLEEVKEWARNRDLKGPLITKAKLKTKTKNGIPELREAIARLLPWDEIEFRSTQPTFPPLKDTILKLRGEAEEKGGVIVTPGQLLARVRKKAGKKLKKIAPEDLAAVTTLLAGEGVLFKLPYGDLVVLQPSWINCYAATLIKLARDDPKQIGHVPMEMIAPGKLPEDETKRLSLEDEEQMLPALIALLLQRAVAWRQHVDHGEMLVFPYYALLPRPKTPKRPGKTLTFRFTGPLEEIYCTLVVRMNYSQLFAGDPKLYRGGVDFHTDKGCLTALTMTEDGERGELELYFDKDTHPDVQGAIHRFAMDHLSRKAQNLVRLREFHCPKCDHPADRSQVEHAQKNGRKKMLCGFCDPDDAGVIELHDALEEQISQAAADKADKAEEKAAKGISTAYMEGVMVGEVQTIVFGAEQIYKTLAQPDVGVDGEIEFCDDNNNATGLTFRVQLKSGSSHLQRLKDGTEKYVIKKENHVQLWARRGVVPLLLIIRDPDSEGGGLRFMNATKAIRVEQRKNPGKKVTRFVFKGETFDEEALLNLRAERLKGK